MSIAKCPGSDFEVNPDYDLDGLENFPIFMTAGTKEANYFRKTEKALVYFSNQGANILWYTNEGGKHEAVDPELYFEYVITGYDTDKLKDPVEDYEQFGQLYQVDATDYICPDVHFMQQYHGLYVPDNCLTKSCQLLIAFHGSGGCPPPDRLNINATRGKEILAHAGPNDIVVLFPFALHCDASVSWKESEKWDIHPHTQGLRLILDDIYGKEMITNEYDRLTCDA